MCREDGGQDRGRNLRVGQDQDGASSRGLLDPYRIAEHLADLPVLNDDGLPEDQQQEAAVLRAMLATASGARLDKPQLENAERQLARLSDAIARRYFLQGAEPLRASGLTLA